MAQVVEPTATGDVSDEENGTSATTDGNLLCGTGGLVSGTPGDTLGGRVEGTRLYSPAPGLLNVINLLACF